MFCDPINRPIEKVVLVDNAAYSFVWNLENGIPIVPFYDNRQDRELIALEKYLKAMVGIEDVREYNK
jgi:CTD small phosphatase-like protein 2